MKYMLSILAASLLFITACGPEKYVSNWNEDIIVVDGRINDWGDKLTFLEDYNVAVGVYNDSEYLYVCLTTSDRVLMQQILKPGITLWLDPEKSDVKERGIMFPIKPDNFENKSMADMRIDSYNLDYLQGLITETRETQKEIKIINGTDYPISIFPYIGNSGIDIRLGLSLDQLVYEAGIPIADNKSGEFRIEAYPGDQLLVGFQSNPVERPKRNTEMGEAPVNTTGVPGSKLYSMPDPLEVWIKAVLAEAE